MNHDIGQPTLLPSRTSRRHLIALDCLAAVAYTLLLISLSPTPQPGSGAPPPDWVAGLATAAVGLPLCVRRLWPRLVFGIVLVMSVVSLFFDVARDAFAAAAFALYVVAANRPGRQGRGRWEPGMLVGAVSVSGIVVLSVGAPTGTQGDLPVWWLHQAGQFLLGVMVLGVAWTIGRTVRQRRMYVARAAGEIARQAVTEERLRIARELHDVVAHSMSLIAVKASTANHVFPVRPDEAGDALKVIESSSRSALTEMRHLLGVLRSEPVATDELAPVPGLSALPELANRAAMAGVQVELDVEGAERLPEGGGVSAYRIVQEALTNVVKHAAPARCQVTVRADERGVRIDVTDDGPGRNSMADPGAGHGLIGMRERVAMYGGEFSAGPGRTGGFRVTASWEFG